MGGRKVDVDAEPHAALVVRAPRRWRLARYMRALRCCRTIHATHKDSDAPSVSLRVVATNPRPVERLRILEGDLDLDGDLIGESVGLRKLEIAVLE